ncbi:hypothetical protein VOLCADRAFT_89620 [Volvox carteri f. nagariensis]|uniref:U3 small nucleolar RNA-associated protein 11 n=1 Tax=Volvox carteri f. nagariensis TaxID=3068 RepID=D8TSB6_VOLCA|nr:uncharacterized protein VOLCADRAFT_89620 [Volvox carteri f. nagariensis]EFJ49796.1 hypothetical protein VOLCADRAFT_89620 [Volvox carteri f. nagariensis]|eukprot:XP_002949303.1 hypothetical protein VOLCADRAFT_89620 [Volvox carteri f. nagariensis]
MTALANAIKRKTHKERSQPAARKKYGLLEKHKDYVERAKNFHKKEKILKTLKRKAEERNPDEFYFAMEKARTKDGVHDGRLTQANKYSQEELRLMKTQDVKYLSMKATTEANKAARLRESLHFIGVTAAQPAAAAAKRGSNGSAGPAAAAAGPAPRHTVFVDSEEEAARFNPAEYFDTPAELLDRTFNRPRSAQLADPKAMLGTSNKGVEKRKYAAYKELAQRLERRNRVAATAEHLAYEKLVMCKGRKRKLRAKEIKEAGMDPKTTGKVFVWKRERRR